MTSLVDELGVDETRTDADEKLRAYLEQEHLILEMQATKGWELWRDYVIAEMQGYQNRLLKGVHKDLLDYKYDAGLVEGVRMAIGASDSLARRIANERLVLSLANEGDQL